MKAQLNGMGEWQKSEQNRQLWGKGGGAEEGEAVKEGAQVAGWQVENQENGKEKGEMHPGNGSDRGGEEQKWEEGNFQ